jgi:hypothetical protein
MSSLIPPSVAPTWGTGRMWSTWSTWRTLIAASTRNVQSSMSKGGGSRFSHDGLPAFSTAAPVSDLTSPAHEDLGTVNRKSE